MTEEQQVTPEAALTPSLKPQQEEMPFAVVLGEPQYQLPKGSLYSA